MNERTPSEAHAEDASELVLLGNDGMRARRRPLAIVFVWWWQALFALVIAWPLAVTAKYACGAHPRGDAQLWNPGALELLDFLTHARPVRDALVAQGTLVVAVAILLGLVPTAALLTSMTFTRRDLRAPRTMEALGRALPAYRPMAVLLVVATALEIGLVILGVTMGAWLGEALSPRYGEARAEQIGWIAMGVGVLAACGVGVVEDVARAAVVRFRVSARRAVVLAVNTVRRGPLELTWSWAWRAIASFVPVVFGSLVAERIGGRGGSALLALAVIHQVIVLARVALRASWLAKALRAVDAAHRVVRAPAEP